MDTAQLIKKHYIDPIARSSTSIGVEVELPLVSVENIAVEMTFIKKLAGYIEFLGFQERKRTLDGDICEWMNKDGDICSFETTWNILELSMKNNVALLEIADRFYYLLIRLQEFCWENGYYLCGKGIHPNYESMQTTPLRTPILLAKSKYLEKHTKHHDGQIFHALCASVQTHIDAGTTKQYLERFNLLRRAYVFDGLFFANSLPPCDSFLQSSVALKDINRDTLCFRDELWRNCDAPNVQVSTEEIKDEEGFCQYLMDLKLFILPEGEGFRPIEPISFRTYCEQTGEGESGLCCLRSLEPVAPTQGGCLEIRSTCMQPLDMIFAPSAFYLGLAENASSAKRKIDFIYRHFFEGSTPQEVRDRLMNRSNEALRQQRRADGMELLEIAINGLKKRNFGEEKFLETLRNQFHETEYRLPALRDNKTVVLQMKKQMEEIRRNYG